MSTQQYYYHYTSTAGANGIRNDRIIRSQSGVVILSTLKPENHIRDEILRDIYGSNISSHLRNRADNVVVVEASILDSTKLNKQTRTVYRYNGEIRVSASDVKDKPRCVNTGSGGSGNNGPSHTPATFYYFYTSENNAASIKRSGRIPCSVAIVLTTMKPEDHFRDEILNAIYGKSYDRTLYATCADWCIKIDAANLDARKLKQRGALYEYTDSIRINSADVIDKPKCAKAASAKSSTYGDDFLFHYTNTKGAQAIKAAGYLQQSGQSGAFGAGVYMTNLKPDDFFRDDILKNNYGGINAAFKGRADWVVKIKKSKLDSSKLTNVGSTVTQDAKRQIFVYRDIIRIQSSDVFDKPKCYRAK